MTLLFGALILLVGSGMAALLLGRWPSVSKTVGVGGAVIGCLVGLVPAFQTLATSVARSWHAPWQVPYGELALGLDPLTAFFLVPIFGLGLLCALYGGRYLQHYRHRPFLHVSYTWFNLLVAAMAVVVAARNALLFLVAWEVMSLASFFLVTFEDERSDVREAGWTYLIATHLGTAFLLAFFALCGRYAGSLDFDRFRQMTTLPPAIAGALFSLGIIGFGTKAGFMPFHVWLPEAHPAAPSHVSALMSGVMIKMGIYGILRALTFLGPPPAWWGWLLVVIGLTSGILGVLFALAQHDLKRLLAYSSIENIGIIALGIGIGLLGRAMGHPLISFLGFGGALLHVLNHGLFKSLLFFGAGAVAQATGTREMEHLGGLLKRMPRTAIAFLVGCAAICGLPPFNGFISEWLIYSGSFRGILAFSGREGVASLAAILGLALIGGLAAACFAKVFGVVFLGSPRTDHASQAHEVGLAMTVPMGLLATACVVIGLWPAGALQLTLPAVAFLLGMGPEGLGQPWQEVQHALTLIGSIAVALIGVILLLALLRRKALARRQARESITWGCGYAFPTARMQYTASSFAQPLLLLFKGLLRTRFAEERPAGYFPSKARIASHTPDVAKEYGFRPIAMGVVRALDSLRWLQRGRVQWYLLYIVVTLVVLLIWKLGM
ncbi:MAG: hypothetical protein COV76_08435 [Candidatus Omnitrophica bacterium CG11_big_fil_rev_8_21_14_0_20_64_10]|nr:MAG: hypothetical protein COV76_08435 [Candidatus Omnitrophica bacterium CG11_big_fil_rev_8_21_14_0_20_64_10]